MVKNKLTLQEIVNETANWTVKQQVQFRKRVSELNMGMCSIHQAANQAYHEMLKERNKTTSLFD